MPDAVEQNRSDDTPLPTPEDTDWFSDDEERVIAAEDYDGVVADDGISLEINSYIEEGKHFDIPEEEVYLPTPEKTSTTPLQNDPVTTNIPQKQHEDGQKNRSFQKEISIATLAVNDTSATKIPQGTTTKPGEKRMVDYQYNPTRLFNLLNHQLWTGASAYVEGEPVEASIWITASLTNNKNKGHWEYLPIHIACMNCTTSDEPTEDIDELILGLMKAYPEGVRLPDLKGDLPIHHAIRSGATAKVLAALLLEYPDCVEMVDSHEAKALTSMASECSGEVTAELFSILLKLITKTQNSLTELEHEHEKLKTIHEEICQHFQESNQQNEVLATDNKNLNRTVRILIKEGGMREDDLDRMLQATTSEDAVEFFRSTDLARDAAGAVTAEALTKEVRDMKEMNELLRMSLGEMSKEYTEQIRASTQSYEQTIAELRTYYKQRDEETGKKLHRLTKNNNHLSTTLKESTMELQFANDRYYKVAAELQLQKEYVNELKTEVANLSAQNSKLQRETCTDNDEKERLRFEVGKLRNVLAEIQTRDSAIEALEKYGITADGNRFATDFQRRTTLLTKQLKEAQRKASDLEDELFKLKRENKNLKADARKQLGGMVQMEQHESRETAGGLKGKLFVETDPVARNARRKERLTSLFRELDNISKANSDYNKAEPENVEQQEKADDVVEQQENVDDVVEQQEEVDDVVEQQEKADDVVEQQEKADDVVEQQEEADDVVEQQEKVDDVVEQTDKYNNMESEHMTSPKDEDKTTDGERYHGNEPTDDDVSHDTRKSNESGQVIVQCESLGVELEVTSYPTTPTQVYSDRQGASPVTVTAKIGTDQTPDLEEKSPLPPPKPIVTPPSTQGSTDKNKQIKPTRARKIYDIFSLQPQPN